MEITHPRSITSLAHHLTYFKISGERNDLFLQISMWTALRNYLFFSSTAKKRFAKWHVYFSLLVQEQTAWPCSLEISLFSSCDLTCLNFFEFVLPEKKIQAKFDFIILRWINHKTPPLSQTRWNIHQIQKNKYIQHWVFVQLSFILQQY